MAERDPDFAAKAVAIIDLELHPPTDGPTFCVAEKTGIGVRTPAAPSPPVAPKRPARREFEYVRHGTAAVLAAFCVNTGEVTGIVRRRHTDAVHPLCRHTRCSRRRAVPARPQAAGRATSPRSGMTASRTRRR